jgi:hypothetical protein
MAQHDLVSVAQSAINAYINGHVRQINRDMRGYGPKGYSLVVHTFRKWLEVHNRGIQVFTADDLEFMVKYARHQGSPSLRWMFA